MKTIYDLKETYEKVEVLYKSLLEEYNENPSNFDYEKLNCLAYQISNACDILEKGVKKEW